MVKDVIPPVDKEILAKELTADKFVKATNSGNNEIFRLSITRMHPMSQGK